MTALPSCLTGYGPRSPHENLVHICRLPQAFRGTVAPMSVQAMAWVLECSRATGSDRLVLLAIANHASKEGGEAWPSIPLIAAEARVSERTVSRSLIRLAALGELEVVRGGGRGPNQYRPNLYSLPAISTGMTDGHPSGMTDATNRGDKHGKSGVTLVADKPSLEPSGNRGFCKKCGETTRLLDLDGVPTMVCATCEHEEAA